MHFAQNNFALMVFRLYRLGILDLHGVGNLVFFQHTREGKMKQDLSFSMNRVSEMKVYLIRSKNGIRMSIDVSKKN